MKDVKYDPHSLDETEEEKVRQLISLNHENRELMLHEFREQTGIMHPFNGV